MGGEFGGWGLGDGVYGVEGGVEVWGGIERGGVVDEKGGGGGKLGVI